MAFSNKFSRDVFSLAPTQGVDNYGLNPPTFITDINNHKYLTMRSNGNTSLTSSAQVGGEGELVVGGHFGNASGNITFNISPISHNYTLPWMIVVAVLLFLLVIITIFGNLLVIVALFRYRTLRSISNYLIGNLAVSDFLLAVTILPMSAVNQCLGYWVFGEILCQFWLIADVLYCTASIWNLCIIAFDRFTATLYPLWYREKRTLKQAIAYIIIVWILSFAISVPPLLGWNDFSLTYVYNKETDTYACVLFQIKGYVAYSASGSFFIPFLITVFLYIRIFGVLRHRIRKMRASGNKRNKIKKAMNKPKGNDKSQQTVVKSSQLSSDQTTVSPHEIELSTVRKDSEISHTEAYCNKSMVGSDSQGENRSEEDEDSAPARSDHPLYVSSSEAEVQVTKNGVMTRGNNNLTTRAVLDMNDSPQSGSLVINNTGHHVINRNDKDGDQDNIQIMVTEDNSSMVVPNNNTDEPKPKDIMKNKLLNTKNEDMPRRDSEKSFTRRLLPNPLKKGNPFKKDREKTRNSTKQRRFDQREVRATIRMAIIIAFFCGCWVGFFIIYVVVAFCGDRCYIPGPLDAFMFWLGYSNSAMNPILYTIFNDDFRKAFEKLLGCHKPNPPGGVKGKSKH